MPVSVISVTFYFSGHGLALACAEYCFLGQVLGTELEMAPVASVVDLQGACCYPPSQTIDYEESEQRGIFTWHSKK